MDVPDDLLDNVSVVENLVKFDGHDFVLEDNTKINADVLIYCTGYVYNFPFLDESSGIVADRQKLYPLVRNFINKEHPSMAFIGLNDFDVTGDIIYFEVTIFIFYRLGFWIIWMESEYFLDGNFRL